MVKYVGPALILIVEVFGIIGKINKEGAHYWWVIVFSLVLIAISLIVYFVLFVNKETGTNEDELIINEKQKEENA